VHIHTKKTLEVGEKKRKKKEIENGRENNRSRRKQGGVKVRSVGQERREKKRLKGKLGRLQNEARQKFAKENGQEGRKKKRTRWGSGAGKKSLEERSDP